MFDMLRMVLWLPQNMVPMYLLLLYHSYSPSTKFVILAADIGKRHSAAIWPVQKNIDSWHKYNQSGD
jgi:hypothetical protein